MKIISSNKMFRRIKNESSVSLKNMTQKIKIDYSHYRRYRIGNSVEFALLPSVEYRINFGCRVLPSV